MHNSLNEDDEPPIPEDVYDIPPPILNDKHYHGDKGRVIHVPQEIYDIPASLRSGLHASQDLYDFPRELEEKGGERRDHYVYDVPPQVGGLKSQSSHSGKDVVLPLNQDSNVKIHVSFISVHPLGFRQTYFSLAFVNEPLVL